MIVNAGEGNDSATLQDGSGERHAQRARESGPIDLCLGTFGASNWLRYCGRCGHKRGYQSADCDTPLGIRVAFYGRLGLRHSDLCRRVPWSISVAYSHRINGWSLFAAELPWTDMQVQVIVVDKDHLRSRLRYVWLDDIARIVGCVIVDGAFIQGVMMRRAGPIPGMKRGGWSTSATKLTSI